MTARTPRVLLLALPLAFTACREAKVTTYRIPKEAAPHSHPAAPAAPAGDATTMPDTGGLAVVSTEAGGLTWTAPATWQARPGSAVRKGSYTIGDESGPTADLAITAFPGDVGGDLANVNRWRGQVALPPITAAELPASLTPLAVAGLEMKLADLAGGTAEAPIRMLGAIVPHGSATWFFKLTGPADLVAREKPAFLAFLQTVKIAAPPPGTPLAAAPAPVAAPAPTDMSGTPVVAATGAGLKWSAPAHWQVKPGTATRKATFVIANAKGSAELAVTAFPGDVGGDLANLNRWRGQLGLPPVSEAEFPSAVTRLNVNGLALTVVDLTAPGENAPRLLGAMVPSAGSTWFFKLTGPAALVADEKPAFLAFLQTLSAP
jgi:hypothetical protein